MSAYNPQKRSDMVIRSEHKRGPWHPSTSPDIKRNAKLEHWRKTRLPIALIVLLSLGVALAGAGLFLGVFR